MQRSSEDKIIKRSPKMKNNLPSFLFIGGPKCGSTWIYKALKAHPEIYVPEAKELFFFDKYYNKGFDWYLSYFKNIDSGEKAFGEVSHDYLYSAEAANKIAIDLPDLELILTMNTRMPEIKHYLPQGQDLGSYQNK